MKNNKPPNPYKYYFIGTQIALTVFAAVFIGYQIDKLLGYQNSPIMLALSTMAIFYSLYVLMRDVNKEK